MNVAHYVNNSFYSCRRHISDACTDRIHFSDNFTSKADRGHREGAGRRAEEKKEKLRAKDLQQNLDSVTRLLLNSETYVGK